MALSVFVGSLNTPGVTGSQAYTGIGFQPNVVIFYANNIGAFNNANYRLMLGCAVSSSQRWAVSMVDADNAATSTSTRSLRTNRCIEWVSTTETVQGSADLTSMDSDGFTLNWSVVEASTRVIFFLALAGTDLANVFAGSFDLTTSAGTQAVTGVGFAPDAVLLAGSIVTTTEGPVAGGTLQFGVMTASEQWAVANTIADNSAVNATWRAQRTDRCYVSLDNVGAFNVELSRSSLDSGGFTVTKNTAPAANRRIGFLCLKGPQVKLGAFTEPTTNTTGAVTGVGFQPQALLLASFTGTAQTTGQTNAWLALGATRGSSHGAVSATSTSGSDPMDSARASTATACLLMATGNAPTPVGTGAWSSFDSDGFTLSWTDTDGTARQLLYWVIGATAAPPGGARAQSYILG